MVSCKNNRYLGMLVVFVQPYKNTHSNTLRAVIITNDVVKVSLGQCEWKNFICVVGHGTHTPLLLLHSLRFCFNDDNMHMTLCILIKKRFCFSLESRERRWRDIIQKSCCARSWYNVANRLVDRKIHRKIEIDDTVDQKHVSNKLL